MHQAKVMSEWLAFVEEPDILDYKYGYFVTSSYINVLEETQWYSINPEKWLLLHNSKKLYYM